MKNLLGLLVAGIMFLSTAQANAATITFDDITTDPVASIDGVNYAGFQWHNLQVVNKDSISDPLSGLVNGVVSGKYSAQRVNSLFPSIMMESSGDFLFNGGYFTSTILGSSELFIKGYNNGSLVFTESVNINNLVPTLVSGLESHGLVDKVTFDNGPSCNVVMDNISYSTPVPEPGTAVMGLMGLMGLATRKKLKLA